MCYVTSARKSSEFACIIANGAGARHGCTLFVNQCHYVDTGFQDAPENLLRIFYILSGQAVKNQSEGWSRWEQENAPLFGKDGGHGMIFRSFDNKLFLALHQPNDSPKERPIFIQLTETENGDLEVYNT